MTDRAIKERAVSRESALSIANQWALDKGALIDFSEIGNRVKTTWCSISINGIVCSNGCGKGIADQSKASALFEAIEHYYSIFSKDIRVDDIRSIDLDGQDSILDGGSPPFRKLVPGDETPISRTKFTEIPAGKSDILYPTFLLDPDYSPKDAIESKFLSDYSLKRYSTNSGFASGSTVDEAILHGLLEVIERDALGVAIIRSVIKSRPDPMVRFKIETLPASIKQLIAMIESDTSGIVTVWNIQTDIMVPSALARITVPIEGGEVSYFGSGASLSGGYAIERSVLEALQHLHLVQKSGNKIRPTKAIESVKFLPKYLRCAISKGIFYYPAGDVYEDFDWLDRSDTFSPGNQINDVILNLEKASLKAYSRIVYDKGPFVTQVVIPGAERFHLVARGVPVIAGPRGQRYMI